MRVPQPIPAVVTCAVLIITALLFPARSASGQVPGAKPDADEPVLLDVRISDVASATLQGQRSGDTVLLPARDICALAELQCATVSASNLTLEAMASLLHAHVSIDWGQLVVQIEDCDTLPVVRRHARAAAQAALAESSRAALAPAPDRVVRSPMAPNASLRIGYAMFAASSSLSQAVHLANIGAATFRGAVTAQLVLAPPTPRKAHRLSLTSMSWRRAWYDGTVVRQLQLGDVPTASGATLLRGISINNTPYAAANGIDSIQVSDVTAPGGEIQVFRDGTLVAAGHADSLGVYKLWVPSMYGVNSFTLASYDQFGSVNYVHRSVLVQPGMLPAPTLRYSIAAGRCVAEYCRNGASLAMSIAPSSRLTNSVTADVLDRGTGPVILGISAQLIARLSDALSASVTRFPGAATLTTTRFAPTATLDMLAEYRAGVPERGQIPGASSYGRSEQHEAIISGSWRPARSGVQPSFLARLSTQHSARRSSTVAHVSAAIPLAIAYVAPFAHYSYAHGAATVDHRRVSLGADALVTPVHAPPLINRSIVRLRMETVPAAGQPSAVAAISLPLIGSLRLDVQTDWRGWRIPTMSFTIRQQLGGVRIASAFDIANPQAPRTLHTMDASFVLDVARPSITTVSPITDGTAAITGIVFADQNRNGRLDEGEQPISGAYVRTGDTGALSDSLGRYELLGVAPFTPTILQVDPLTLPAAGLVPLYRAIRAEPVPDEILHIDIPIVEEPTGER